MRETLKREAEVETRMLGHAVVGIPPLEEGLVQALGHDRSASVTNVCEGMQAPAAEEWPLGV